MVKLEYFSCDRYFIAYILNPVCLNEYDEFKSDKEIIIHSKNLF